MIIGTTFTVRVVIGMLNKAIRAIGISKAPVVFVNNEAEAIAHIARCRAASTWR